jgi:hypothetical protein
MFIIPEISTLYVICLGGCKMLEVDNVTYYRVSEILKREDNFLSEDEIISFLKNNPSYGIIKD